MYLKAEVVEEVTEWLGLVGTTTANKGQQELGYIRPCSSCIPILVQQLLYALGTRTRTCEALLRTTSTVSIVTIEVVLVALKSKLEVKTSATKLPSCVTVKT